MCNAVVVVVVYASSVVGLRKLSLSFCALRASERASVLLRATIALDSIASERASDRCERRRWFECERTLFAHSRSSRVRVSRVRLRARLWRTQISNPVACSSLPATDLRLCAALSERASERPVLSAALNACALERHIARANSERASGTAERRAFDVQCCARLLLLLLLPLARSFALLHWRRHCRLLRRRAVASNDDDESERAGRARTHLALALARRNARHTRHSVTNAAGVVVVGRSARLD